MFAAKTANKAHVALYGLTAMVAVGLGILSTLLSVWLQRKPSGVEADAQYHFYYMDSDLNPFYIPAAFAWYCVLYFAVYVVARHFSPASFFMSVASDLIFQLIGIGLGGGALVEPFRLIRLKEWYFDNSNFSRMALSVPIVSSVLLALLVITAVAETIYVLTSHGCSARVWSTSVRTLARVHRHSAYFPPAPRKEDMSQRSYTYSQRYSTQSTGPKIVPRSARPYPALPEDFIIIPRPTFTSNDYRDDLLSPEASKNDVDAKRFELPPRPRPAQLAPDPESESDSESEDSHHHIPVLSMHAPPSDISLAFARSQETFARSRDHLPSVPRPRENYLLSRDSINFAVSRDSLNYYAFPRDDSLV